MVKTQASAVGSGDDVHVFPIEELCQLSFVKRPRGDNLQLRQMRVRLLRIAHFFIDPSAEKEGSRGGMVWWWGGGGESAALASRATRS